MDGGRSCYLGTMRHIRPYNLGRFHQDHCSRLHQRTTRFTATKSCTEHLLQTFLSCSSYCMRVYRNSHPSFLNFTGCQLPYRINYKLAFTSNTTWEPSYLADPLTFCPAQRHLRYSNRNLFNNNAAKLRFTIPYPCFRLRQHCAQLTTQLDNWFFTKHDLNLTRTEMNFSQHELNLRGKFLTNRN